MKEKILFVTKGGENCDEGFSYVLELAKALNSNIAVLVVYPKIPGTMVYFKSLNTRISVLFTIPLGFATGMLAATIAVGGFIGVPAMIYVLGPPASWPRQRNL